MSEEKDLSKETSTSDSGQTASTGGSSSDEESTITTEVPGAGEETAASETVDSDQDPPTHGHGDINRF